MSEWVIKRKNDKVQDIPIYDEDGDLLTTLGAVTEAKFVIKEQEEGVELVAKTLGAGLDMDTPIAGYVRLTLDRDDTNLTPKYYYMALQLKWGLETKEVYIKIDDLVTEKLKIIQDIIT